MNRMCGPIDLEADPVKDLFDKVLNLFEPRGEGEDPKGSQLPGPRVQVRAGGPPARPSSPCVPSSVRGVQISAGPQALDARGSGPIMKPPSSASSSRGPALRPSAGPSGSGPQEAHKHDKKPPDSITSFDRFCFASDEQTGTVKLHIGAGDLEGSTGTFRDAHVEFQDQKVIIRCVDKSGHTWTLRSAKLPGPIVADECRFQMDKTGKDLSITLKKANVEENWDPSKALEASEGAGEPSPARTVQIHSSGGAGKVSADAGLLSVGHSFI